MKFSVITPLRSGEPKVMMVDGKFVLMESLVCANSVVSARNFIVGFNILRANETNVEIGRLTINTCIQLDELDTVSENELINTVELTDEHLKINNIVKGNPKESMVAMAIAIRHPSLDLLSILRSLDIGESEIVLSAGLSENDLNFIRSNDKYSNLFEKDVVNFRAKHTLIKEGLEMLG